MCIALLTDLTRMSMIFLAVHSQLLFEEAHSMAPDICSNRMLKPDPRMLTITVWLTQLTFMPELLTKYVKAFLQTSVNNGHWLIDMVNVVIVSLPGVWCAGLNGSGLSAEIPPEAPSWCLVIFAGISTNPTLSVKAMIWVKTIVATEWFTIVSVYSSNVFNVTLHPQNIIVLVTRPASYSLLNGLIQGNGFLGAI